jgi:hypothetical protein
LVVLKEHVFEKEIMVESKCIRDTNEELFIITNRTIQLIEDCIKKYAKEESKTEVIGTAKSTMGEKVSNWIRQ